MHVECTCFKSNKWNGIHHAHCPVTIVRDLEARLADAVRHDNEARECFQKLRVQYGDLEQENANLRAMGTAENVRLSALCASLKEENARLTRRIGEYSSTPEALVHGLREENAGLRAELEEIYAADAQTQETFGKIVEENERLRAELERVRYALRIYDHAYQSGNCPSTEAQEIASRCAGPIEPPEEEK